MDTSENKTDSEEQVIDDEERSVEESVDIEEHLRSRAETSYLHDKYFSIALSMLIHAGILFLFVMITLPVKSASNIGLTDYPVFIESNDTKLQAGPPDLKPLDVNTTDIDITSILPESMQLKEITDSSMTQDVPETDLDPITLLESSAGSQSEIIMQDSQGFSGAGGTASAGTASFFGLEAHGSRFIYVVDYSGSMRGEKLHAAKTELIRSISSLDAEMDFYIIFYDNNYVEMPGGKLVKATDSNKRKYFAWIERIDSGGGTIPSPAVRKALSLSPDAIWLLSDGNFPPSEVTHITQANPGKKIQIHTIAFHDNSGEEQLKQIAKQNRGRYHFVPGRTQHRPF